MHGYPVQFLSASPGLESEAVKSAIALEWENHRIRVMRPEHLAAIALTVGRSKDRARVVYLVALDAFDHSLFRNILTCHDLVDKWQQWASALGLEP